MPVEPLPPAIGAVSRHNRPVRQRHGTSAVHTMSVLPRDALILRLVGQYKQATTSQLKALFFGDVSREMLYRSLHRLQRQMMLRRVGHRDVGERGGSGAHTWQLTERGHTWAGVNRGFVRYSSVDDHALLMVDIYVALKTAEDLGVLRLADVQVEQAIGHARADMLIRYTVTTEGHQRLVAVEAEATRKRAAYTQEKCGRYVQSLKEQDGGSFPTVLFVAADELLEVDLRQQTRGQSDELFKVTTLGKVVADFIRQ